MHPIRSHRLIYVQVPQVVVNVIISYRRRDFALPVSILWSTKSGEVRREVASED